jgi:type IV pilus assembly protein PilY1
MDLSTVPLDVRSVAKPNIIFGLDDSGSMDNELLLPTNDGAAWWQRPGSGASGYTDATGKLYFNANGNSGSDGTSYWYKYTYLFPNGTTVDARTADDAGNTFAIPPIPVYAYFRSPDYNPLYYNPSVTYQPWGPAYLSSATRTFSAANSAAARSHPWLPTSGTPTTINLAANLS